jgi:two-component system LytT family response regulator
MDHQSNRTEMSKIRVLTVDDEAPALRRLVKMVENHSELTLMGTARNAAEAKTKILHLHPDLVLLDIELKDQSAFDILNEIKNQFKGKIIFSTAYDQYAIKAFEVQAIDYLLKPYSEERFNQAIERILEKNENSDIQKLLKIFQTQKEENIRISEGNKNYFFHPKELLFITADGYYAHFKTQQGEKMIRVSLKNLESSLPSSFIRINKSTIINTDFISEWIHHKTTSKLILSDKSEFYISEKYGKEFQEKFQSIKD